MDKKEVKQIEITTVKVNALSCSPDVTGEYCTSCDIDFFLSAPFVFSVFDKEHSIDRINMGTNWGDETELYYANQSGRFYCFPITKTLIHKVYDRVRKEQKGGCLAGWSFHEDIFEMLSSGRATSSYF
ncbi:hypothetical protein [Paenibacillus elgii]|uniref:hypothetical protein n=1 Tax=Paenibacillus elgii TaxID=189691 RepID=UPI002040082B|nr:hypothetical protein [Paenibacillus elgii]MCM3273680.1 hypothetical protein [Paenibacillus elgii]